MKRSILSTLIAMLCVASAYSLTGSPALAGQMGMFCIKSSSVTLCSDSVQEIIPYQDGTPKNGEVCIKNQENSFCVRSNGVLHGAVGTLGSKPNNPWLQHNYNIQGVPFSDSLYRDLDAHYRDCMLNDGTSSRPTC